jgi:predicted nucleotidyltransferase
LATHPEILFALLYGSAIESETFRDLDIGIFVDRAIIHASTDLDYSFTLENRLRKALAYPVDVRVINDAPLGFRYNVSRGVALVVNDPPSFYHFLERTWDEYLDFEPIGLQYLKEFQ